MKHFLFLCALTLPILSFGQEKSPHNTRQEKQKTITPKPVSLKKASTKKAKVVEREKINVKVSPQDSKKN